MLTPIRLKKPVGEAYNVTAEDALSTKNALAQLGHMDTPDYGLDEFPDAPMIEAIKSFQRRHGLTEDGVMKPDGPTLERLNASLRAAQQGSSGSSSALVEADKHQSGGEIQTAQMQELRRMPNSVTARGAAQRLFEKFQNSRAPSAAAAGAAGALLSKKGKEAYENGASSRMEPAPSFPPPPGIEPPDMPLPDRTESPNEPVEIPDLSTPLPKIDKPTIFVLPAPAPGEFGDGIVERKGNEATRKELERIRDYFVSKGWKHVAGGRYGAGDPALSEPGSKIKVGDERSEYHVPGHFKDLKGGHFTDLTFEMPNGRKVHIQSVDVDRNGKPTQRELDNAEKIRRAEENTDVILIPKGAQLETLKR